MSPEATGEKGQGGVGLAVCKSFTHAEARSPEFISDGLLKVTLELCGRARAVTFVVGHAPIRTQAAGKTVRFLESPEQGRKGSAREQTAVRVNER